MNMAYSTAMSQSVAILLFIHFKTEEGLYEYLATKKISEELGIPVPTIVKILGKLNAAGLTHTKEGAKGGILLARPISDITFLEIFNALEQGRPLFKVQYEFNIEYEGLDSIAEKGLRCLQEAEKAMKTSLKKTTLSDLLK
jgi:Rrf2 family protein